jgi:putative membrane protein
VRDLIDKLNKLSGSDFDREYVKAMVNDHEADVGDFRRQSKRESGDPDVKRFAAATLPTLESHLQMAQDLDHHVGTAPGLH